MFFARTESFLVCVQSSWFVGEADIARIVLTEHGIPCHIENEHFHMWHWLYANITGGFKVQVPREHAVKASRILSDGKSEEHSESDSPSWQCPECGWTVDGDWDVCWFCTTTRDGIRAPSPNGSAPPESSPEDLVDESELAQIRAAAVVLPLAVLFWTTGGSLGALVIAATAALVGVCLNDRKRLPSADTPPGDVLEAERIAMAQPLSPAEQSYRRRVLMGNRVVQRALCAAVFGFAWFPPLLILSAALLWRLDRRKTPLNPWRRRQARMAWCLCTLGFLVLVFCAVQLAQATTDAIGLMGTWR